MKKIVLPFLLLTLAKPALAICPVCTVAVIGGLGLSRYFGIDDIISGLWIGGLAVSLSVWTVTWLTKKNIKFLAEKFLVPLLYYCLIIIPLYLKDIIGHPLNTFWGIDKLLLGIILGSLTFWLMAIWYSYLKQKNQGHAYFPFQKVVMPISPLIVLSVIFYFLTK